MRLRLKSSEKINFVQDYYKKSDYLTLSAFANDIEVSLSTLVKWFSQKGHPRPKTLAKLCKIFNCEPSDLLRKRKP